MRIAVVTVGQDKVPQANLVFGLSSGIWGFTTTTPTDLSQFAPGTPLLLATGYKNSDGSASPRRPKEEYENGIMGKVYLTRAAGSTSTGNLNPLWPDETALGQVLYPDRIPVTPLALAQAVSLPSFPVELAHAFHRSINTQGSAVFIDLTRAELDRLASLAGLNRWPLDRNDYAETKFDAETDIPNPPRQAPGQGRVQDPIVRAAIEKHAVAMATAHYASQDWHVTELGKPYDLKCERGAEELHVEVKGTRSLGSTVVLTRNEVQHADEFVTDLFIVSSISLSFDTEGRPITSGGDTRLLEGWKPESAALKPLSYEYEVPWAG